MKKHSILAVAIIVTLLRLAMLAIAVVYVFGFIIGCQPITPTPTASPPATPTLVSPLPSPTPASPLRTPTPPVSPLAIEPMQYWVAWEQFGDCEGVTGSTATLKVYVKWTAGSNIVYSETVDGLPASPVTGTGQYGGYFNPNYPLEGPTETVGEWVRGIWSQPDDKAFYCLDATGQMTETWELETVWPDCATKDGEGYCLVRTIEPELTPTPTPTPAWRWYCPRVLKGDVPTDITPTPTPTPEAGTGGGAVYETVLWMIAGVAVIVILYLCGKAIHLHWHSS